MIGSGGRIGQGRAVDRATEGSGRQWRQRSSGLAVERAMEGSGRQWRQWSVQ